MISQSSASRRTSLFAIMVPAVPAPSTSNFLIGDPFVIAIALSCAVTRNGPRTRAVGPLVLSPTCPRLVPTGWFRAVTRQPHLVTFLGAAGTVTEDELNVCALVPGRQGRGRLD